MTPAQMAENAARGERNLERVSPENFLNFFQTGLSP
jgi:hypothetical protein